MPEQDKEKTVQPEAKPRQPSSPLIFISHDSRDAELAGAFSKLLRSVSAGMLKSFRSSDKKGTEGIEFGDEWYKRLMNKLDSASDVVCLLTERSMERPWILYEAGVAKGKLGTPVFGVALGITLSKVSTGPFYQFQNCDDSDDSLTKLVMQLAKRIPSLEPDNDVVNSQVQAFKSKAETIITTLNEKTGTESESETPSASATAKLLEELKVMFRELPLRVEDRLSVFDSKSRRRKPRRIHPAMFENIMHMAHPESGPINILIFASLIRDDAPWLYEIAIESYRILTSGTQKAKDQLIKSLRLLRDYPIPISLFEELGMMDSKEMHMLMMDGPRIIEKMVMHCIELERMRS